MKSILEHKKSELHKAIQSGAVKTLKSLVSNQLLLKEDGLLHDAVKANKLNVMKYLIENPSTLLSVMTHDNEG